jgi:hypothetical protein
VYDRGERDSYLHLGTMFVPHHTPELIITEHGGVVLDKPRSVSLTDHDTGMVYMSLAELHVLIAKEGFVRQDEATIKKSREEAEAAFEEEIRGVYKAKAPEKSKDKDYMAKIIQFSSMYFHDHQNTNNFLHHLKNKYKIDHTHPTSGALDGFVQDEL